MGNVNCLRCRFRHEDNGNCTEVGGFCTAVPAAHCPLLRQYLDTGMTPEAYQSYVVFLQDLIGNQKASEALDNFRQLVKANRDGRLAVLPCKVGDIVWANLDGMRHPRKCVIEFVNIGSHAMTIVFSTVDGLSKQYGVNPSAFGKTVFLTCEKAKAALEAMKDGY